MDRAPHCVSIALRRSRLELAWVVGLALATLAISLTLTFDRVWVAIVPALPVAWALDHLLRGRRRRPMLLALDLGRGLRVVDARGAQHVGSLSASSYVGARLVTLVWRPAGATRARAAWILPDMLDAESARRLRVLLRYGHSDAAHGSPRSQA